MSTILQYEEPVSLKGAKRGPSSGIELMKRVAFRDLVRLYVAIDNTNPEIILRAYQAYQDKLAELENKFLERREKLDLFYQYFKCLDRKLDPNTQIFYLDPVNYNQYFSKLKHILSMGIQEAWKQLHADIIQYYPQQLPQPVAVVSAEDSDMLDRIAADSAIVDAIAGTDTAPAVITTVVGVPSADTMTGPDAMEDGVEEPKRVSSTPFWSTPPTPTAENTVAQLQTGLTL